MTRTLLFHCGLPKTGTTSIQNACFAARGELLAADRVLYPSVDANHTDAICTLFMDDPTLHISNRLTGILTPEAVIGLQARYRASLVHELERAAWDTLVISAEGAANLTLRELASLRDWFAMYVDRIEVICYLREPVGYTTSVTQQVLKGGATLAALHKDPDLPHWKGRLENAIGAFGREAVRVRDFGAAVEAEGGLVADFCDQLGLGAQAKAAVVSRARVDNEALSMEAALMMSALNTERPLFTPEGRLGRRTGAEMLVFEALPGNKFTLPLAVRREVYEKTRADAAWVDETFGARFMEMPPPSAGDQPADPGKTLQAAHATALLISDLLNAVEALKACLQARHMVDDGNLDGARIRLDEALRLCPDEGPVMSEVARIRSRHQL